MACTFFNHRIYAQLLISKIGQTDALARFASHRQIAHAFAAFSLNLLRDFLRGPFHSHNDFPYALTVRMSHSLGRYCDQWPCVQVPQISIASLAFTTFHIVDFVTLKAQVVKSCLNVEGLSRYRPSNPLASSTHYLTQRAFETIYNVLYISQLFRRYLSHRFQPLVTHESNLQ
jgi:hypothetical protein